MRKRQDSLVNVMTGLGDTEVDLRLHTTRSPVLHPRQTSEYQGEWRKNSMAYREVSQVAGDMFREGLDLINFVPDAIDTRSLKSWLEGDTTPEADGSINRTFGLLYYAQKVIEIGDKVGGAALFPVMRDGLDPAYPIDWRRIEEVVEWVVFDRSELIPYVVDGMGTEPDYWMLSSVTSSSGGHKLTPGQVIHKSRLWRHKGVELSDREERFQQWWGDSELERNWDSRRAVEEGLTYANTYLHRASWLHYSFAELNETYGEIDENTGELIGPEIVDKRMRQTRQMASTIGIMVTDGGRQGSKSADGQTELAGRNPDKIESVVEKIGDLVDIVELNRNAWQAGFGAPRSIAFGEAASALRGGENAGDWKSWEGTIRYKRKVKRVQELVNWMLTISFASRNGPTRGLLPTQWEQVWRPLVTPSPKEKAEIDKARAEADNMRIEKGVAKPDEVRDQRIVQGDVEGQLRASAEQDDVGSTVQPAQVGIAEKILEGALAVANGQISEEYYAAYLMAIDPIRFTESSAAVLAAKASKGRGQAVGTTEVASSPGQTGPINASTLFNAGSQVAQGKLNPEFMSEALHKLDPVNYPVGVAEQLTNAAAGVDPSAPPEPVALAAAPPVVEPTADAEPGVGEGEGRMPESDPLDKLLSAIPSDLMTTDAIAEHIKSTTGLDVSTQRIHALAKRYSVPSGRVGSARGFSFRGIKLALALDNGLELPADDTTAQADAFRTEHSGRQVDPGDFIASTFRRIKITDGIDAIVGKLRSEPDGGMVVQTYRFATESFTPAKAKAWLRDHGMNVGKFEAAADPK